MYEAVPLNGDINNHDAIPAGTTADIAAAEYHERNNESMNCMNTNPVIDMIIGAARVSILHQRGLLLFSIYNPFKVDYSVQNIDPEPFVLVQIFPLCFFHSVLLRELYF